MRFEGWLLEAPASIERWKGHSVLGNLQFGNEALVMKYLLETNTKNTNEDEKFELLQLRTAEAKRLCDLDKRLDTKAHSRENDGARGAAWRLRSCWISEAGSIKAFRSGTLNEGPLTLALKWMEDALKAFYMDNP